MLHLERHPLLLMSTMTLSLLVTVSCATRSSPPVNTPERSALAPASGPTPESSLPSDAETIRRDLLLFDAGADRIEVLARRAGDLHAAPGGPVMIARHGGAVISREQVFTPWWVYEVPVEQNVPASIPLFCEESDRRLIAFADRGDFSIVARGGFLLRPTASSTDDVGVMLRAGESVLVTPERYDVTGPVAVEVRSAFLSAQGWTEPRLIGVAYRPGDALASEPITHRLQGTTPTLFYDGPQGEAFATLAPYPSDEQSHFVRKLDEREGFALVEWDNLGRTRLTGWVDSARLVATEPEGTSGSGYGSGSGRSSGPLVTLPEGTLLSVLNETRPVGVVTREQPVLCVDHCETNQPHVRISTCWGPATLQASIRFDGLK